LSKIITTTAIQKMPQFNIEKYLYSLPENTTHIDISCRGIYELSDITRFTNLQYLDCDDNNLTSLPTLPESLIYLSCNRNKIRSLPKLPSNLRHLYCADNKLTSLPELPANLEHFHCQHNKLNSMPFLPKSISSFGYCFNPIWEMRKQINSFRYLYYSLKFKRQFKNWLWEKVRKPKIDNKYHPKYLMENLNEDIDLDGFLDHWVTC